MGSRLVIGYESALDFWRAARAAAGAEGFLDMEGKVFGARDLTLSERVELALSLCKTTPPLNAVVADAAHRHSHDAVKDHVWKGPLAEGQLFGLGRDIYVCRMPAVFSQLAQGLDTIELMRIAFELTGTYGIAPWLEKGVLGDVPPLLDTSELLGYATSARALGVRGATRACEALKYVVPNSNSPRETDVAIALALPRTEGGLMYAGFRMNEDVVLPESLVKELGQSIVRPDFSWPNGTVAEYDSKQEHLGPEARARDERKRRAYQAVGLDCLTITNEILRSDFLYDAFEADLSQSLGVRRRPLSPALKKKRQDLRGRLFGAEVGRASSPSQEGEG